MKWIGALLAMALTVACASMFSFGTAHAQEAPDPLIDPPEGGAGSRFQVVGQRGWVPGETVQLRAAFSPAAPLSYPGPFTYERTVNVLRDGTWSFPIVVNETLFGRPPGATPGYIVVRAEAGTHVAQNAYVYSPNGVRPAGAEEIAHLGFGPGVATGAALMLALFAGGTGALFAFSGAWRYREAAT